MNNKVSPQGGTMTSVLPTDKLSINKRLKESFFNPQMWTIDKISSRFFKSKMYKTFVSVDKIKMSDVDEVISTLALVIEMN